VNTAILATGWYVVNSGETTLNLTVNGDVKLILANGCTLTANGIGPNADIGVFAGNTLTRYGQTTDTGTVEAIGDGSGWFLREQTPYDSIGVCMYDARQRKNEYVKLTMNINSCHCIHD
jgi:hypothetical protein